MSTKSNREKIITFLSAQNKPLSIRCISDATGMTNEAARFHVSSLLSKGVIEFAGLKKRTSKTPAARHFTLTGSGIPHYINEDLQDIRHKVWDYIKSNPRSTVRQISDSLGKPVACVRQSIKLMCENGFLRGNESCNGAIYTAVKRPDSIGLKETNNEKSADGLADKKISGGCYNRYAQLLSRK